jgi:hypothetical protein
MSTGLRSPKLTKPIRHAIDEAKQAYEFVPSSYTASALNAVLAVEQVYLREADRIAQYLDHHDTTSNHPTTNPARTP